MFKKTLVLSLAIAVMLLGLFVGSSAAQNNVASVSKRGSFFVLPKIDTTNGKDTIVMIGNDAAAGVRIKCYWMDDWQYTWDFEVDLTAYQPLWFSAKTGVGSKSISQFGEGHGELKCWAINVPATENSPEQLRKFNYLYANAIIIDPNLGRAFEYNAWSFYLDSLPADLSGALNLAGGEYDFCPGYLIYNFFAENAVLDAKLGPAFGESTLSLSPCTQDLRQDREPICAKAKFDVWNENENKLTGAYQCIKCWFEGVLSEIGTLTWDQCDLNGKCKVTGVGGSKFTKATLKTNLGRFRVSPDTFTACRNVFAWYEQDYETVYDVCQPEFRHKTPFLGVLLTDVAIGVPPAPVNAWAGSTGTTAGIFDQVTQDGGFKPRVLWDADNSFSAPKQ